MKADFFVSSFVSRRSESHVFPQLSGTLRRHQQYTKQAENEQDNHRWNLTRMVSQSAGRQFKPGG
jgi:hypothetical protein